MIQDGYVLVNARLETNSLYMVQPSDTVSFSKKIHDYANQLGVLLIHKPRGVWTHCKQGDHARQVMDALPKQFHQYASIGRLDKASEGLILFTNDGIFARQFLTNNAVHDRRYLVWTRHELSSNHLQQLSQGMVLSDGLTQPATVAHVQRNCYSFILTEGKNRQIRRMVEAVGSHVIRLKRTHFDSYSLGNIESGGYRHISLRSWFMNRVKGYL